MLEHLAAGVEMNATAKVSAKANTAGQIELATITRQDGRREIAPRFEEWGEGIYLSQENGVLSFIPYEDIITMTATPVAN